MTGTRFTPSRRTVIAGGAAVAAGLAMPALRVRTAKGASALKVGVYGGYFKDSFDEHIFPAFTEATGVEVQSIAEPTGSAWMAQLQNALLADQVPADVNMIAQTERIRGENIELWAPLDENRLPNATNLLDTFVSRYPSGAIANVGAVSWYITLVTNTEVYPDAPESWAEMWDPRHEDSIGLLALASNSFLLEVTASTYFGGTEILSTEDGVLEVMAKLAELKDNVRLWYRDEGQFQAALQVGEIPMGQYYHDVTGLAAADGFPVRSTFPKEGGVLDSGSWCVLKNSKMLEEAHVFMDYMCQPEIQTKLSLRVGTAPTVRRDLTSLTDADFAAVSSDIPPIIPEYGLYLEKGDWVAERWAELVTGA